MRLIRAISGQRLVLLILLVLGITVGLVAPEVWEGLQRRYSGVAPGVSFEGYQIGGLLPEEVDQLLGKLSQELEEPAADAYWSPEEKRVVPERLGRAVDLEQTKTLIFQAESGQELNAILEPVYPRITHAYFQPVYRGDMSQKKMALMINVAWGNEYIPGMLKVLEETDAKATFFFIGEWVERFPQLFMEIVSSGHEIANHGYWHGHPKQMSLSEQERLITKGQEVLVSGGAKPAMLFAPPAGEFDDRLLRLAAGLGYRTIMWTIDTVDWKRPAPEVLVNRVLSKAQNGGLVLMHPTEPTLAALPRIIKGLQDQGYQLSTVSELL